MRGDAAAMTAITTPGEINDMTSEGKDRLETLDGTLWRAWQSDDEDGIPSRESGDRAREGPKRRG